MITPDDAEKLAREYLDSNRWADSSVMRLARFVLAVAPVLRAAEEWRDEIARKPRPTDAEVALSLTIDEWRGRK